MYRVVAIRVDKTIIQHSHSILTKYFAGFYYTNILTFPPLCHVNVALQLIVRLAFVAAD